MPPCDPDLVGLEVEDFASLDSGSFCSASGGAVSATRPSLTGRLRAPHQEPSRPS